MSHNLLISDAAKEVNVESHVLRYWEEELQLPIKRNELGHRYYTREDVERFKQIKSMKERGLQLKAIKMILKDGKLQTIPEDVTLNGRETGGMAIHVLEKRDMEVTDVSKEEKTRKLQWLLRQMIVEAVRENNQELCREIKESVVKELDYQFRVQEEREEERENRQNERQEAYYQKVDELLRKKVSKVKKSEVNKMSGGEKNTEKPKEKKASPFKKCLSIPIGSVRTTPQK